MEYIKINKEILSNFCEENMVVHSDWTGSRVETKSTCSSIDEFTDKLYEYLETYRLF